MLYLHFLKTRRDLLFSAVCLLFAGIVFITNSSMDPVIEYVVLVFLNGYLINEFFLKMTTSLVSDRLKKTR